MRSIYASKLYRASSRKQKIQSAMGDPINSELIQQLEEYLDDTYISDDEPEAFDESQIEDDVTDEKLTDGAESPEVPIDVDSEPDSEPKFEDDTEAVDEENDTPAGTNATTHLGKSSVVASKSLCTNLNDLPGELKGTLNARANTAGVVRCTIKDDEVWIYYNDSTNLNTIMTDVIDLINAANYSSLTFNRLARTDNAMVFTINLNDTINVMEPISNA